MYYSAIPYYSAILISLSNTILYYIATQQIILRQRGRGLSNTTYNMSTAYNPLARTTVVVVVTSDSVACVACWFRPDKQKHII